MDKTMQLGDKTINRLGFGAMRITGEGIWGPPKSIEEAKATLKRAVELGVNFIDTADAYGPALSEDLIHDALSPYPDDLVIATKGGLTRTGPGVWVPDGRPEHIREAVEGSLRRLGVEQIYLYQSHRPDPKVPYEDTLKAFFDLQAEGKIKHVGLSNVSVEQLQTAMDIGKVTSVQNSYSVLNRVSEDVLKVCEQNGIAFIPYFPIGGNSGGLNQQVLDEIAKKHNATARQVGLAWLLQHSPVILPIPGTGRVAHVEQNMKAADVTLDPDDVAKLDLLAQAE
jgi:aryl-alcohol dehydrogenase-like predicted oxidoreductase